MRKILYILGQDVLFHHCIRSGENLILLKFFEKLKFFQKFEFYFLKNSKAKIEKKALHRIVALSMLYHYHKLQKNLITTTGRESFQILEIQISKKFTKI